VFESASSCQKGLNVSAKDGSWREGFFCCRGVMVLPQPMEKVIWSIRQCTDLSSGNIQQVAQARRRISQAKPEITSPVDEDDSCRCPLLNQMEDCKCSTYSSTDDCDCRGWYVWCRHSSTLGRTLHRRNSQILMPYKEWPAPYTPSGLLLGHASFSE
jgi:hypothetical protein